MKFSFLLMIGAAVIAFLVIHPPKKMMCEYLSEHYDIDFDLAMKADYNYIKSRYQATKKGKPNFLVDGKLYVTQTGRAV